jgi:hypothetical protein
MIYNYHSVNQANHISIPQTIRIISISKFTWQSKIIEKKQWNNKKKDIHRKQSKINVNQSKI